MQDQAPDEQQGQQEEREHERHFRIGNRPDGVGIRVRPSDAQIGVGRQVDHIDRPILMPPDPDPGKAEKQKRKKKFPQPAQRGVPEGGQCGGEKEAEEIQPGSVCLNGKYAGQAMPPGEHKKPDRRQLGPGRDGAGFLGDSGSGDGRLSGRIPIEGLCPEDRIWDRFGNIG